MRPGCPAPRADGVFFPGALLPLYLTSLSLFLLWASYLGILLHTPKDWALRSIFSTPEERRVGEGVGTILHEAWGNLGFRSDLDMDFLSDPRSVDFPIWASVSPSLRGGRRPYQDGGEDGGL